MLFSLKIIPRGFSLIVGYLKEKEKHISYHYIDQYTMPERSPLQNITDSRVTVFDERERE